MTIEKSLFSLQNYCQANSWRGYDPYDGLNGIFQHLPVIKNSRLLKLSLIHLNKRSLLNLRQIQQIPKNHNAKGIALFLSGAVQLYSKTGNSRFMQLAHNFIRILERNVIEGFSSPCWGYYFPWQSRAFYIPANTPSVVVTSFVGNALLDAYDVFADKSLLNLASRAQDFIIQDLNRHYDGNNFCFSYTPMDESRIYNASLLGASFLARLYLYEKEQNLKSIVKQTLDYCVRRQNDDGSWFYGEADNQKWIDHYHTNFMLDALIDIHQSIPEFGAEKILKKGFSFYIKQMFHNNVIPKFHHDKLYPIEPHCGASAIITLCKISNLYGRQYKLQAERIADWFIRNMMDSGGFFYFQKNRFFKNKISYMRWVQAWMFKALAMLSFDKNIKIPKQTKFSEMT